MSVNRLIYKNMKTTYRIELNETGLWIQFGERGWSILWRK